MAESDPELYQTKLSDGRLFGEAILTPTHLYVNLVRDMQAAGLDLHYMVNVTGHGWRKLMRANADFTYIIDAVPAVPTEFTYMQQVSGTDDTEMYGNFNMGAGFAVYLPDDQADKVIEIAAANGLKSMRAGHVETGAKQVVIRPKNITFSAETLEVR